MDECQNFYRLWIRLNFFDSVFNECSLEGKDGDVGYWMKEGFFWLIESYSGLSFVVATEPILVH